MILAQTAGTVQRILALEKDHQNQSMLNIELAAIDWIYQNSDGKNFRVYSYLPSIKDYPYQYLLWWRGQQKYQKLPCKYGVDWLGANSYSPHASDYQSNAKCDEMTFLIIEPALHQNLQDDWYQQVSKGTQLIERKVIGKIIVEKRAK